MTYRSRARGHVPALLGVFAFLLRALVPLGYMPAALANGGPFILCHWQSPALAAALVHGDATAESRAHAVESGHTEHGEHTDHDASQHDSWGHCPLGVGVGAAPLAVEFDFAFAPRSAAVERPLGTNLRPAPPLERYRARAPPL